MKYVVDKKRWLRGGKKESELLTSMGSHGKMCCLGFVCRQSGIKKKDILHVGLPAHLPASKLLESELPQWLYDVHSINDERLAEINDDKALTDKERMAKIKAIFKSHGDEIVFR